MSTANTLQDRVSHSFAGLSLCASSRGDGDAIWRKRLLLALKVLFGPGSTTLCDVHPLVMEAVDRSGKRGFAVSAVTSVAEANRALDVTSVDLAVLDIHLWNETSFGIAARLISAGIPFVFLTGSDGAEVPQNLRHVIVVSKPFEPRWLDKVLVSGDTHQAA